MSELTGIDRTDETWHRLLEWTDGQAPSERLAAQILVHAGYVDVEPSHPLGGPDGGRDGLCRLNGERAIYAVYFPRGQQIFSTIQSKLQSDLESASKYSPARLAFVTNQELRLGERKILRELGGDVSVDVFHLERIAVALDSPDMHLVREQYLKISAGPPPILVHVSIVGGVYQLTDSQDVISMFTDLHETKLREQSDKVRKNKEAARIRENGKFAGSYLNFPLIPTIDPVFPDHWGVGKEELEPIALTEAEIAQHLAKYETELKARWDKSEEYIIGLSGTPLKLKVKNLAKSFLNNVEIVITLHGVKAVKAEDIENFNFEKVEDTSWKPARARWEIMDYSDFSIEFPDQEISWSENEVGDLEIVLTLDTLRPHPEWRSREHHPQFILTTKSETTLDAFDFTYTVTASGYGDYFESDPIQIPVHRKKMKDVLIGLLQGER